MLVSSPGPPLDGDVVVAGRGCKLWVMVMFFEPLPGSMPSVLREAGRLAMRGVDLDAPDGEAVAAVVGDVEVGGVAQRDAVEGEVVGVIADDEAGDRWRAAGRALARSHALMFLPRNFSPPRPSMTPSPMTPAPETW